MSERVEVVETTWRVDAAPDRLRRLATLLLGSAPSSETRANMPTRPPLDASGPGGQASDARRSVRGATKGGDGG